MKCSLYVIQLQTYWPVNALKKKEEMVDHSYLPPTPKSPENTQVMFTFMSLIAKNKRKKEKLTPPFSI